MVKNVVIFGVGNIAELAAFYLTRDAGRRVAGFTVDEAYITAPSWNGHPVVAWEEVERHYAPERTEVFVAVSYTKLNKLRRDKVAEARAKGYGIASYVSSRATIFDDFVPQPNQQAVG